MIAFLRGELLENDGEAVVVDVAGVGYQVLVSAATAARAAGRRGGETRLYVHTHFVKDEPLRLYGFADAGERALFQTLISVQGVGPRVALAILAGIEAGELVRAIATGDVGRLTQVKGVGRKTAERLALELREKILTVAGGEGRGAAAAPAAPASAPRGPLGEVYGALVQLGYKPGEIEPLLEALDPARPSPIWCARRWRALAEADRRGAQANTRTRPRRALPPAPRVVSAEREPSARARPRRRRGAAPAQLRRVRRPAEDRRQPGRLRPGGAQARRRARSRPALRAARAWARRRSPISWRARWAPRCA